MVRASELSDIELLNAARPFLRGRVTRNQYVAAFRVRIRRYFRQGLTPTDVALRFGLSSPAALRYNTDQAQAEFFKDGDAWKLRDREATTAAVA